MSTGDPLKLLFLDLDGVIRLGGDQGKNPRFDANCVERVVRICKHTGAKIVILSDLVINEGWNWKQVLGSIMSDCGPVLAEEFDGVVFDPWNPGLAFVPEHCNGKPSIVRRFLNLVPACKAWCIIDDVERQFADFGSGHLISPNNRFGLQDSHVTMALLILGGSNLGLEEFPVDAPTPENLRVEVTPRYRDLRIHEVIEKGDERLSGDGGWVPVGGSVIGMRVGAGSLGCLRRPIAARKEQVPASVPRGTILDGKLDPVTIATDVTPSEPNPAYVSPEVPRQVGARVRLPDGRRGRLVAWNEEACVIETCSAPHLRDVVRRTFSWTDIRNEPKPDSNLHSLIENIIVTARTITAIRWGHDGDGGADTAAHSIIELAEAAKKLIP
jgi:hypothetical protein